MNITKHITAAILLSASAFGAENQENNEEFVSHKEHEVIIHKSKDYKWPCHYWDTLKIMDDEAKADPFYLPNGLPRVLYSGFSVSLSIKEIQSLKDNDTLHYLNLMYKCTDPKKIKVLSEALKTNKSISIVRLSYNEMNNEMIADLAEALMVNERLVELDLCRNGITCEGAKLLAEALKKNVGQLEVLELYDNEIGDEGAIALAEAMKHNTKLQKIGLHHNYFGKRGEEALENAQQYRLSHQLSPVQY